MDIQIELGGGEDVFYRNYFNVSDFLSGLSHRSRQRLNKHIIELDKKVHITRDHEVYVGLDIIIEQICEKLPRYNRSYHGVKWHLVGSLSADTKVGLPLEADYLLELPSSMYKESSQDVKLIENLNEIIPKILSSEWELLEISEIQTLHGACLIMKYENESRSFGITVDLVFACKVTKKEINDLQFTQKAKTFLGSNFDSYLHTQAVHIIEGKSLKAEERGLDLPDMGLVENRIIQELPEGKKRGYRVAKYLTQYIWATEEPLAHHYDTGKDYDLFGHRTWVKSYYLRALFLHLIFLTHDTQAEMELEDGVLTMCLLKMLISLFKHPKIEYIKHPMVNDKSYDIAFYLCTSLFFNDTTFELADDILNDLASDGPFACMDEYKLINSYSYTIKPPIYGILRRYKVVRYYLARVGQFFSDLF